MRRRDVAAWMGCLILFGATTAWAQAPDAAGRAKLRTRIAALRGEVELLRMEHDADVAHLKAALSDLRNLEDMESALPEFSRMTAELKAKHGDGAGDDLSQQIARLGAQAEAAGTPGVKGLLRDFDPERQQKIATDIDLSILKMLRPLVERKKKEFAARTAALHEKSLELEDLERQYREPAPAAMLGSGPSSGGGVRACGVGAVSQRIAILDPIPGDPKAECCLDPPSEDEVWREIPRTAGAAPEAGLADARFVIEKIGEKVDPCKVYPLAGPCQLVHCQYKATVSFDEWSKEGPPAPVRGHKRRTEVVHITKDHLRRCGDAGHAHAKPDGPGVVRASLTSTTAADSGPEGRMTRMEEKLDRILKALGRSDRDD